LLGISLDELTVEFHNKKDSLDVIGNNLTAGEYFYGFMGLYG
jgi:hypothetical protein